METTTILDYNTSTSPTAESANSSSPSTEKVVKILLGIITPLLVLCTVVGNVLIITAIARFHRLQNVTNCFITSLACADLIMGLIVIPLSALDINTGIWFFNKCFCKILYLTDVLCVTASIGTLCVIAMDRYLAITSPFRYQTLLTKLRARIVILLVWVIAALTSFPPIIIGGEGIFKNVTIEFCNNETRTCEFSITRSYAIVSCIISFYIPLLIMIFVYSRVFQVAKLQLKKIEQSYGRFQKSNNDDDCKSLEASTRRGQKKAKFFLREHKALKTLGIIMGVFTLCWLPFFLCHLAQFSKGDQPDLTYLILNWIGYSNSAFNPIIYCRSPDFRHAFMEILCWNRNRLSNLGMTNGYTYSRNSWQNEPQGRSKGSSDDSDTNERCLEKRMEVCCIKDRTADPNGNNKTLTTVTTAL